MSGPFLSFVTTRAAIAQLPAAVGPAVTSDDILNAIEATIAADSIYRGGENASNAVRDLYDKAKREVTYSLPVGDDGSHYYYSLVPSYKFDYTPTSTNYMIRFVKLAEQRITFKNLGSVWALIRIHWAHTDGTSHVEVLWLPPGKSHHH